MKKIIKKRRPNFEKFCDDFLNNALKNSSSDGSKKFIKLGKSSNFLSFG